MFFNFNKALGPPYHVLVDTNFINFSIQNKLDIKKSMMDCLYGDGNDLFIIYLHIHSLHFDGSTVWALILKLNTTVPFILTP